MSLPTVIAENQTVGGILLTRLGLTVGASSSLALTDYAFVDEIKADESLHAAIVADQILLNLGQGTLSKGDSLKFFAVQMLEVRRTVRLHSNANVTLSGTGTIDSVASAVDDRVLLSAQTTASENGIWVVKAGAWQRPPDFETGDSAAGAIVMIEEGTTYANQVWQVTTNPGSDIIGTNNLALQQLSGSGGGVTNLQTAYDGGNTIVTASSTPIAFTLTSGSFTVDDGSVLFGGATPLTAFNVDAGLMSLDSTDTTNLSMAANAGTDRTLTIAASNAGVGDGLISMTADGTIDIDSAGALSLNSSGAAINIGNDAVAQAINIGTGAAARTISVGNATSSTQLNLDSGTGGTLIDSTGVISLDGVGASNFTTDSGNLTVATTTSGGVLVSSAGLADIQAVGAVTIDSSGSTIGMGTDADDGAINIGTGATAGRTITIGNNTGTTGVAIETGTGDLLIDSPTTTMTGNLVVQGTTTTVKSEIVNIADSFLYLNDGYETVSAQTGGFVVNSLPTATNDTVAAGGFTAGVASTSNATVVTAGSGTFTAGDLIQVKGAANQTNDGLYEVLSHVGTTLSITGVGVTGTTHGFTQNDFTTDTTVQGTIRKVTVGVEQVDSTGGLQYGYGSSTSGWTFNTLITEATLSLQSAYDGGNTITTSGGNPVIIAGSEELNITATGGLNLDTIFDFDGTIFDVLMTGNNGFSIDGTANSNLTVTNTQASTNIINTISAANTGAVAGDATVDITATSTNGSGIVEVQADTINVGTDASANTTTIGNNTGATGVNINSGSEKVEIDGVTYYGTNAGAPTATISGFQDGDKYYDTNLDMEMRYDATRAKWLSVEAMTLYYGRNGKTRAGQYYRGIDGRVHSATIGWAMPHNGAVVSAGYTRSDTDVAIVDINEDGASITSQTMTAAVTTGVVTNLNANFSAGGVISMQNRSAGGNTTSNVQGWVKVKWRV